MFNPKNVYAVKPIHFCPYPETGEFACVGVVIYSLTLGYFDYRLADGGQGRKVRSRINGFFPEIPGEVFKTALSCLREVLDSVHNVCIQGDLFISAEDVIKNICRPRENIIAFGRSSVVTCDNPQLEIDAQFKRLVMRSFVEREPAYLNRMEESLRRQLRAASLPFQRREFKTAYADLSVTLPFCFGEDLEMRAIKPLDFGKRTKDVVDESLKWRFNAEQIQESSGGMKLLCPARYPAKNTYAYQAMMDLLGHNNAFELCPYDLTDKQSLQRVIDFARSA